MNLLHQICGFNNVINKIFAELWQIWGFPFKCLARYAIEHFLFSIEKASQIGRTQDDQRGFASSTDSGAKCIRHFRPGRRTAERCSSKQGFHPPALRLLAEAWRCIVIRESHSIPGWLRIDRLI